MIRSRSSATPWSAVVAGHAADDRGEEGVVQRLSGDVSRRLEPVAWHVDRREVAVHAAPGHERTARPAGGSEHLADGPSDLRHRPDGRRRMHREVAEAGHGGDERRSSCAVGGRRAVRPTPPGRRVGQQGQQADTADAVRQRMVDLEEQGGAAGPVDEDDPPQRPGRIERLAGHRSTQVEELA